MEIVKNKLKNLNLKSLKPKDWIYIIAWVCIIINSILFFVLDLTNFYLLNSDKISVVVMIILYILITMLPIILVYKSKITKDIKIIAIIALVATAVFRIMFADYKSGDYIVYLEGWLNHYRNLSVADGLKYAVGNYSPPYNYFLQLFAKLPIFDLYMIKVVSYLFEVLTAIYLVKLIAKVKVADNNYAWLPIILAIPMFFIDSSVWAQCDSIYTFFLILGIYLSLNRKSPQAFVCFGVSLAFKLQAVFLFPAVLVLLLSKNNEGKTFLKWRDIWLTPLAFILLTVWPMFFGRSFSDTFLIYLKQSQESLFYCGAMSFWIFFQWANNDYSNIATAVALIITLIVLVVVLYKCLKKVNIRSLSNNDVVLICMMITFIVVMLLPKMHERYFYITNLFMIVYMICNKDNKNILLFGAMSFLSSHMKYTSFNRIFSEIVYTQIHYASAVINTISFIYFMVYFVKYMKVLNDDKNTDLLNINQ